MATTSHTDNSRQTTPLMDVENTSTKQAPTDIELINVDTADDKLEHQRNLQRISGLELKAAGLFLKIRRTQLDTERIYRRIARQKLRRVLFESWNEVDDDDDYDKDDTGNARVDKGGQEMELWTSYPHNKWEKVQKPQDEGSEKSPNDENSA